MNKLFILDTVILLNAMLSPASGAAAALNKANSSGIIIVSDATLDELYRKVSLPKFEKYLPLKRRLMFYKTFSLLALNIHPTTIIKACRDPKDDMFLSLAVSTDADYIITLDGDLLALHPFQNIPIITPAEFLKLDF
jgi:uncharacterized protein